MTERQKGHNNEENHEEQGNDDSSISEFNNALKILEVIYSTIKSPRALRIMSIFFGSLLGSSIVAGTSYKYISDLFVSIQKAPPSTNEVQALNEKLTSIETKIDDNISKIQCNTVSSNEKHVIGVKITGFGLGFYDCQDIPEGSSKLTPLVYTDRDPFDSSTKKFAVLKNVDLQEEVSGQLDPKRDSQSYQAKLMQIEKKGDPVCLLMWGNRLPEQSSFMNIAEIHEWQEDWSIYNEDLPDENNNTCCQIETWKKHC